MKNKNKQTKFPVARIKKIMQKDEEVGKVAQATPIVISKALELFLAMIIDESSKVTLERGSKKVEAYHLKHAVETTEMLDFLKEIVEGVPDPSAGGTIDLESENAEGAKKKRGKGKKNGASGETAPRKRRKKKDNVAPDVEGKSEPEAEGDAGMDEGDEEMSDRKMISGSGYKPEAEDWRESDEDTPFIPRPPTLQR